MPVGLVIVSHSAQLAAGVAELAGQMAQGKTPIAPAGGAGEGILGTSVETILAAIQSVDGPDGVLVLLDLGSAILSTEMALEMLDDEQRQRVALSYAPIVEGAIAAAVESSLGRSLQAVKSAAEKTAQAEQLRRLKPLSQEETTVKLAESVETVATATSPVVKESPPVYMPEVQLTLHNPAGLHARPASLFVQTAARFNATVQVLAGKAGDRQADAASITEVLSLGVRQGETITLRASGDEAQAALEALSELVRANFYETSPPEQAAQPSVSTVSVPSISQSGEQSLPSTISSVPQSAHEPWHGLSTSKGVVVAPAFLYVSRRPALTSIERRGIDTGQVAEEQQRLRVALEQGAQELTALAESVRGSVGVSEAGIFEAQALMLRDPALRQSASRLIDEEHIDAASALMSVGEQRAEQLAGLNDALLAARATDVRDAVSRAVSYLLEQTPASEGNSLNALRQPVILLARDLTPSDTVSLRPEVVQGICTVLGGPTAHAAILARALGIPAIAGINEAALAVIHTGDELGLDADSGLLFHQPPAEVRNSLIQRANEFRERQAALQQAARQAQGPLEIDGRTIHLYANIANAVEAEAARQWGAEGVGLLRTEFLFATAPTLPDEQEQRRRYAEVFAAFKGDAANSVHSDRQGGPVVVRTLDAGADKPMPALNDILGTRREENPALGLRGIRIHLTHQHLLEQQLRALLRAAADTGIELHIMFPMITTVEELATARAVFDRIYAELRAQQISLPSHVPVGIMVEVPSAAVMAPELAQIADFFSIGANDLMQYALASDRTNTAVAHLYNPMQPSVLRLIHTIAQAGRSAGKPVAVCGEIGGDARLAPVLVALGVDELSMAPTALPTVRAALARWSAQSLSELAQQVLQARTVDEVARLV